MSKIEIFKGKGKSDLFDPEDKLANVMAPKGFNPKKYGFSIGDKVALLYKGFPMFFDRTVMHARKEDVPYVQQLFAESVELNEAKIDLFKQTDKMMADHGFTEHPNYPKQRGTKMYGVQKNDIDKFDSLSQKLPSLGWKRDYSYNIKNKSDAHHFFDHPNGAKLHLGNKNNGGKHEASYEKPSKLTKEQLEYAIEHFEELDELSKEKLSAYVKKAADDFSKTAGKSNSSEDKKSMERVTKRLGGLTKANKKLKEEFKPGDKVHLGLAVKGGAGFVGILKKVDNDGMAHVESLYAGKFGKKTLKGHKDKLSVANESTLLGRINILRESFRR